MAHASDDANRSARGLRPCGTEGTGGAVRSGAWLAGVVRRVVRHPGEGTASGPVPAWLADVLRRASLAGDALSVPVHAVGGVVRDLLLERADIPDVDLVVEGERRLVRACAGRLAAVLGTSVSWHDAFGTATLPIPGGRRLDLAMARVESYPGPAALPVVEPGEIVADLWRRDFTVNAMAVRLNGPGMSTFLDPTGGREDLASGVLRVMHGRSFTDDPTRLLRAFQYEARLGLRMEPGTVDLAKQAIASRVPWRLSDARLQAAVARAFSEDDVGWIVERVVGLGMASVPIHDGPPDPRPATGAGAAVSMAALPRRVAPARTRLERADRAWEMCRTAAEPHPFSRPFPERWQARLMVLLECLPGQARRLLASRLVSSRPMRDRIFRWWDESDGVMALLRSPGPVAPSDLVARLEPLGAEGWVGAWAAASTGRVEQRLTEYLCKHRLVRSPLAGRDLVALGMAPGPAVSRTLRDLRRMALDTGMGRAEAEEHVRGLLTGAFDGTAEA